MDANRIVHTLNTGLAYANGLVPLATALGVPHAAFAGAALKTLAEIAANTLERVQDGKIAMTATDVEAVRAVNARVAVANDELAKAIAAS